MHRLLVAHAIFAALLLFIGLPANAVGFTAACDDTGCHQYYGGNESDYCATRNGTPCDCSQCRCSPCAAPNWTAKVNALFLHRDDPSSGILAFNTISPAENLNASNFDFGTEAGVDVSLARSFKKGTSLELRYFGIDGWDASQTVATTPNDLLQFNASPPEFALAGDAIAANYSSALHNAEINASHQCFDWLGFSAGFRYLELNERGNASLVNAAVPFSYAVATRNRLYGAQLGADASLWCGDILTVSATGKAGIYGNHSTHGASVGTNVATLTAAGHDDRASFIGEIGVNGAARLTEHLTLRGGYRLLWLDGVAVASDQLAATDFNTGLGFNGSGDVFYHGAFVGLELAH